MRIVVIGNVNFVTGFQFAGVKDVYEADDSWQARKNLEIIKEMRDVAIVIIQRSYARELKRYIDEWRNKKNIYPIILELPDRKEKGEYEDPMRNVIRRAIGIDIMKR